jgi:hypothetical protein
MPICAKDAAEAASMISANRRERMARILCILFPPEYTTVNTMAFALFRNAVFILSQESDS